MKSTRIKLVAGIVLVERGFSLLLLPPAKVASDDLDHSFGILKYMAVLKSDDLDALVVQELLSLAIVLVSLFIKADRAVELNRESLGGTIEIQNVRSCTMLSSKLPSIDLRTLG